MTKMSYHTKLNTNTLLKVQFSPNRFFLSSCEIVFKFAVQHCNQISNCQDFGFILYTEKLLFYQSPTRHSGYHCDNVVTVR